MDFGVPSSLLEADCSQAPMAGATIARVTWLQAPVHGAVMWLASKIPADPARCFWLRKAAMELSTIKFRFTKLEKGKSRPRANRWTCRDRSPRSGRRRPGAKQHWSFTIPRQETMKRPYWALLALSSFVICTLTSATRPRFGGALTVDLTPTWTTLAPSEIEMLAPLIVETLVRINERGEPESV